MRLAGLILFAAAAVAQSAPQILFSHTNETLRGVSAVSRKIAWASGGHGTYLRTTDGRSWIPGQVAVAESLDFRGVVAFSDQEAFLMSAGPGEQSRIYYTRDAGRHWELQYTNKNPKGFFDSIAFWDRTHGVVLGDPIADGTGPLKFELLLTEDGESWHPIAPSQLPSAVEGEGAFAASNSCIAILAATNENSSADSEKGTSGKGRTSGGAAKDSTNTTGATGGIDSNIWFATGGKVARVFHSPDLGRTWQVFSTPITHGSDSQGIFSIAFRDAEHGVIAGGDYKHPNRDGPNLAFTDDGGKTWSVSTIFPQFYYSAVAYDRKFLAFRESQEQLADSKSFHSASRSLREGSAPVGTARLEHDQVRLFLTGSDFIYDFRPPQNPIRLSSSKNAKRAFNAISPYPTGGALIVGANGAIAEVP